MNCRDFERVWSERFDARRTLPDVEKGEPLEAHAASCVTCHGLAARYRALRLATASLESPSPPAGFADRVLAAYGAEPASVEPPAWQRWRLAGLISAAAAAAVFAAVGISLRVFPSATVSAPPRVSVETSVVQPRPIDAQGLSDALAVATSATWDLARESSAPAARVGRQVIVSVRLPGEEPSVTLPVIIPEVADLWHRVGDRVSAGARPLEGTARHAFGFLLGEPSNDPKATDRSLDGA